MAKPPDTAAEHRRTAPADDTNNPGNWTKSSWAPYFIHLELVKACCLLHGYKVLEDVGVYDPRTGERDADLIAHYEEIVDELQSIEMERELLTSAAAM